MAPWVLKVADPVAQSMKNDGNCSYVFPILKTKKLNKWKNTNEYVKLLRRYTMVQGHCNLTISKAAVTFDIKNFTDTSQNPNATLCQILCQKSIQIILEMFCKVSGQVFGWDQVSCCFCYISWLWFLSYDFQNQACSSLSLSEHVSKVWRSLKAFLWYHIYKNGLSEWTIQRQKVYFTHVKRETSKDKYWYLRWNKQKKQPHPQSSYSCRINSNNRKTVQSSHNNL